MTRPLTITAVAVTAAVLVTGGCGRGERRLGAGEDVNVCVGWAEIDSFDEPALTEPDDVEEWAAGVTRVVERIDVGEDIDDEPVPAAVGRALAAVEKAAGQYREAIDEAGDDPEAVRAATARFAASPYRESARLVTAWTGRNCERTST